MPRLIESLDRLLPSLLMAGGVMLLTVGTLSYAPSSFGNSSSAAPLGGGDPLFTALPAASGPIESIHPASSSGPTASPIEIGPSPRPSAPAKSGEPVAFATRIRIPSLSVDLPVVGGDLVVPGNADFYPLCDVAMYMPGFVQPGQQGTTYIYAHAQRDMFLPLLRASLLQDGAALVGGLIEVYTSDDQLHVYEITTVKRHATDLSLAESSDAEQLVLQTSEGPTGTVPKLQVAAKPVSTVPASDSDAHPSPAPRVCLPAAN